MGCIGVYGRIILVFTIVHVIGSWILIIKVRLGMEFCVFKKKLPSRSTSHVDNLTSISCSELWVLLTKNQDFSKPKNGITIAWAFYAWMNFFPLEVSSNSNLIHKLNI
jgi:hypothetical protein